MKTKLNKIKRLGKDILTKCRTSYNNGVVGVENNFMIRIGRVQIYGLKPYDNLTLAIDIDQLTEANLSEIITKLQEYKLDYVKHRSTLIDARRAQLEKELSELDKDSI